MRAVLLELEIRPTTTVLSALLLLFIAKVNYDVSHGEDVTMSVLSRLYKVVCCFVVNLASSLCYFFHCYKSYLS